MTTTYRYVSLIRATMDNPEWDDEEGDLSLIAGKVPEVYTPTVPADREDMAVVGRRYEREALAELPEWMAAEDAFAWVDDHRPGGFADYYEEGGDE
jgi:hypothetical protein